MNRTVRIVLPLLILVGGVGAAAGLVLSKKEPERKARASLPPKVQVIEARPQTAPASVEALGSVVAAQTLTLQSEIAGRVVHVHPDLVPGGTIKKGEVLLRLDSRQFAMALAERKANEERARFELALEKGRGRVAAREWQLVGAEKNSGPDGRALALREPHLKNAQASLLGAEAAVAKAQLDVSRSVLRAPFDVLVTKESVEVGQIVTPQSQLATLVGTQNYWVRTSVPVSALRWIRTEKDDAASKVSVSQSLGDGTTIERQGSVLRVTGEVDPKGRMAQVIVSVPDPLGLKTSGVPALLLGSYLRVGIEGRALQDVYVVPRVALRDDKFLWVVDAQDKLHIRPTTPVWRGSSEVYVRTGVQSGERVVTSRLGTPVEGMSLRVDSQPEAAR